MKIKSKSRSRHIEDGVVAGDRTTPRTARVDRKEIFPGIHETIIAWQDAARGRDKERLFEKLYAQCWPAAMRWMYVMCRAASRDDRISDVNLTIFQAAKKYDGRRPFAQLLKASISNAAQHRIVKSLRMMRNNGRPTVSLTYSSLDRNGRPTIPLIEYAIDFGSRTPLDRLIEIESSRRTWRSISAMMSRPEAMALKCRRVHGMTIEKICTAMEKAIGGKWTAKRVYNAIDRAADKLRRRGGLRIISGAARNTVAGHAP